MKNHYKVSLFVWSVVVSGLYVQTAMAQTISAGAAPESFSARLELQNPTTVEALMGMQDSHPLESLILGGSFTVGGEVVQDFYVVDTKNKTKSVKDDYIKSRREFLADVKKVTTLTAADTKSIENTSVTKVTLTGKKSEVEKIQKNLAVTKVEVLDTRVTSLQAIAETKPKEARLVREGVSIAAAAPTPMYLSVPKSGISYFLVNPTGGRYSEQHMTWSAINFTSDQTYEHDIFLYNYDNSTYLDSKSTAYPGCYPATTHAVTNWPAAAKPYLDTRLAGDLVSCEKDELAYTIGAAQANALKAGVDYYTYIRTAVGNTSKDKFKLQAQIGHRTPSSCYTTWCSFGDQSYTLVPAWDANVPGTKKWTYGGQVPTAPNKLSVTNATKSSLRINFTDTTFDETNILLERKTGNGSWVSLGGLGVLAGKASWYSNNTSLAAKTKYCYRFKAVNAVGSSPYSAETCGTTLK